MRYNDEQFDALLTRALKLAVKEEWDGKDIDVALPLSPSGNEKMQQLLSGKENNARTIKPKRPAYLRRIAAAVLAALAFGGITLTNPSARAYLEKLIKTWFPDHVQYELTEEAVDRTPDSFEIGYIPDGYELKEESLSENAANYLYKNKDETNLVIQISSYEHTSSLDDEYHNYYQITKEEQIIDVYEAVNSEAFNIIILYLNGENLLVRVSGYLSVEELVNIICSIQ